MSRRSRSASDTCVASASPLCTTLISANTIISNVLRSGISTTGLNKGNPAFSIASFLQGVVALADKAFESAKVAFHETAFLNKEPEFE